MSNARIGALRVDMTMNTAKFEQGAARARGVSSRLKKSVAGIAAAAGVAVAGLARLSATAARAGHELKTLANVANTDVRTLQAWSAATATVSVEQEKLGDILKDVNDRIGDFIQTGGGPMADFFEKIAPRVGVTADQFARLSGPQALQLYVTSLEKANLSQADFTFYLEAMSSDATRLLPLLQNGGAEMQRLTDRAGKLGAVLSQEAVAKLSRTHLALQELGTALRAAGNRIAVAFAPTLARMAEGLTTALEKGTGLRAVLDLLVGVLGRVATVVGAVVGGFIKLVDLIGRAGLGLSDAIRDITGMGTSSYQTQIAVDNLTLAMGDEIRQIAALTTAMGPGISMSRDMATAKLNEASAHLANLDAMRDQARQAVLGSEGYLRMTTQIASMREQLEQIYLSVERGTLFPAQMDEATARAVQLEQQLIRTMQAQAALLEGAAPLSPEYIAAKEEIERIKAALAAARGETVTFANVVADVVPLGDRLVAAFAQLPGILSDGAGNASYLGRTLAAVANAAAVMANNIAAAVSRLGSLARGVAGLSEAGRAGLAAVDQVGSSLGGVVDRLADSRAAETARNRLSQLGLALGTIAESSTRAINAGYEFEAAVGGSGGGGGAAGAARRLREELTPAQEAAKELADTLQNSVMGAVDGVADAFGEFVVSGFRDFKGFVQSVLDSFKSMLAEMIALAAKNRIMVSLGLATAGPQGGVIASGAGSAMTGALGAAVSSAVGGASSVVSGLMSGGLSGAGSALSAALSSGSMATAIGAAIPVIGAVGLAISALTPKVKQLDAGLRLSAKGAEFAARQYTVEQRSILFGLSRSTDTKTSGVKDSVATPLRQAYQANRAAVLDAAAGLGIGAKALRGFTAELKISTKDMSEAEAQAAIMAGLADIQNKQAKALLKALPGTARLQRQGETAAEALRGLSDAMATANTQFRRLGFSVFDMSAKGAAAARRLVENAGGADQFNATVGGYVDSFYSTRDKAQLARRDFRRAVGNLGINMVPQTREEFRNLVERLQGNGRNNAAVGLMGLTPLFDQLQGFRDEMRATADATRDARQQARALREQNRRARADGLDERRFTDVASFRLAQSRILAGRGVGRGALPVGIAGVGGLAEPRTESLLRQMLARLEAIEAVSGDTSKNTSTLVAVTRG